MGEKVCTNRCAGCFFLRRSTGTCDYIFIVGVRRPCLPGRECTAYVPVDRKEEFMRKPNWDTEAGREMWLEGKKDAEIADAFGISVHAVTCYRVKHWQQPMTPKKGKITEQKLPVEAGKGVNPAVLEKIRDNAEKAGINLPGTVSQGSLLVGMKAFDFERGLKPPAGEPETETIPQAPPEAVPAPFTQGSHDGAVEDLTADKNKTPEEMPAQNIRDLLDALADALKELQDLKNGQGIATQPMAARNDREGYTVPKPRLDEMDIVAAATEHLSGMKAVCTACAIQALWYWTGPADLRRAKKNIDWLLDHMEE